MYAALKGLGKMILGNTGQKELVQIPEGSLWEVGTIEKKTRKGVVFTVDRAQIYPSCILTIERADGLYSYELAVHSIAGDESIEETLRFPIKPDTLRFVRKYDNDGDVSFCWNIHEGEKRADASNLIYEYAIPSENVTATTVEMFHVVMTQCLFEASEHRPHTAATDDDLRHYMLIEKGGKEGDFGIEETARAAASKEMKTPIKPLTPVKTALPALQGDPAEELFFQSAPALFYVFDAASNVFVPKSTEIVRCALLRRKIGGPKSKKIEVKLVILNEKREVFHEQLLDPDATLHTDRKNSSYIWCYFTPDGQAWTFSLRFNDAISLMAISNAFGQAIYEVLNEEKLDAEGDRRYLLDPLIEDFEMEDAEPIVTSDSDGDDIENRRPPAHKGSVAAAVDDGFKWKDPDGGTNQQLAIGYKSDRSFVSRGSSIAVFKHTEDEEIELAASLDKIMTLKDKRNFIPSKMMLHEEDRHMILMNPDNPHTLHKMDLEYGKVVEDWTVNPDAKVSNILPDSKYAQMTANPTFIGLNSNSIFRIDPRLSGNKRVDSEMKQYVVKNDFTCGTTTGQGELAVASGKGEIRLFNKLDKRAKTLLPGFGDAILGIDVTESGRLIVATCKTYLLLINTEIPGEDVLGFTKSMGADKPAPKRLQLKPEHLAYMRGPISFTPARFSTGQGAEERSIITSTGPYVITWNLRRVKQGHLYDYQIRKYEDKVVADNFTFGQDRRIVVTLPHHVTMISKRSLTSPSPSALIGDDESVPSPLLSRKVVRDYDQ